MSYRGRGRGRGRGYGRGPPAKELPFELFPEIEGLGKAEYSTANIQLIKWSSNLQKYWNSSPYFYEDRSQRTEKVQKLDIERYSDRNLQATKAKPPLWHFIKLDTDHIPAELAIRGEMEKQVVKRVRWNPDSDSKMDLFEKLEQKYEGQEGKEKKEKEKEKENENEDEYNEEEDEEEGEYSDDGDYGQGEDFDDDEDDYNVADDNNEGPYY